MSTAVSRTIVVLHKRLCIPHTLWFAGRSLGEVPVLHHINEQMVSNIHVKAAFETSLYGGVSVYPSLTISNMNHELIM